MTQQRVKVADDGSVVLPPEVVRAMGLVPGEAVEVTVASGGQLTLARTPTLEERRRGLREAQEIFRKYREAGNFGDGSLVDELIADRRREAMNE